MVHWKHGLGAGWAAVLSVLVCGSPPPLRAASEVTLRKDVNGHWSLIVDGKPYIVRGVDYRLTKVGQSPDHQTLRDWAWYDFNANGRNDGPYEAWVDANRNNHQDPDEPAVGDFHLMQRMGVNTIRWYVNDFKRQVPNKALLRDLYHTYGIRVAVGNKFGAYTIDSGASWGEGTDYHDPTQRARLLESVQRMVETHKDEPYLLLWLLGNENNYRFTNTNAAQYPVEYARLVEEAVQLIHGLDGHHPVALVSGETEPLSILAQHAPSLDIFGVNAYRGPSGFGDLWEMVRRRLDKPVLVTEYGGSAAPGLDEEAQAAYHRGCWLDIIANCAGRGAGNALGGFAFEWLDEWWKAGEPEAHAVPGSVGRQGLGEPRWSQEYCGLAGQGDGTGSPFLRQLRKVYWMYQDLWLSRTPSRPVWEQGAPALDDSAGGGAEHR